MAGLPGINTEYMLGNWFFGKGMTVSLEYLHYRLGGRTSLLQTTTIRYSTKLTPAIIWNLTTLMSYDLA